MNPICFYHSADLDGKCSAAIVRRAIPEVELYGYNYGDPFPWDKVQGRGVIMVDVSLQPFERMVTLQKSCAKLTWIDHHKSAIEEAEIAYVEAGFRFDGLLESGKAACELCWEHFFPGQRMPAAVLMLGRYDVWDHEDPAVLPFQFGMRSRPHEPGDDIWVELLKLGAETFALVAQEGVAILRYQEQQDAGYAKSASFETTLDGHRVIACNGGQRRGSKLFDSVWDPAQFAAMVTFARRRDRRWTVGIYSDRDDIDCGAIAKARGGGGHKGAAGFQCAELPFEY